MKKKWIISQDKREKLEAALDAIVKDYCDYVNGDKPKRDLPFNLWSKS